MGFNPLNERGIPIEKQLRNWSELNVKPYDKKKVDPYTRCRVILMNGIEVEGAIFGHQFARHTADLDLKRKLAMSRRVEQQQQKAVNWLTPGNESALEVTIGYEQVAVDLTAYLARTEPDPYVKQTFDFGLLEDFDHLYRYANLLEMTEKKKAEDIVGHLTEITVGRPTISEHRHPFDDVRKPYNMKKADILTQLHVLTLVAGEQQTMNYYMNVGNRPEHILGRGMYLEIAQIEEQHVTQYESLMDPTATWFEMLVLHEYNECYLYYSFMSQETDPQIKKLWELHLNMEIEHLRIASELMKQYEKKDASDMLPKELPELTLFESNVEYIRNVLGSQMELTSLETEYIQMSDLPADSRYAMYQEMVNDNVPVPTQQVIEERIKANKQDYRLELGGPHPYKPFQDRKSVKALEVAPVA